MEKINKPVVNITQDIIDALALIETIRNKQFVRVHGELHKKVDELQKEFAVTLVDCLNSSKDGLNSSEMALARKGDRLAAMKSVRNRLGCGLSEAKEIVEKWQLENQVDPYGGQR